MSLKELGKQIVAATKRLDRTGQVWLDSSFGDTVILVLGPATVDDEGDFLHPSLVLDGGEYTGVHDGGRSNWYEYDDLPSWEDDREMERIA